MPDRTDLIIQHLEESVKDELFSKSEKKTLKMLVGKGGFDRDDLNFLRSKVYEIADRSATAANYRQILEWTRNATNALLPANSEDKSLAFFSPGDQCRDVIIDHVTRAIQRINICVFTISDDSISSAILTAHKKGVKIQVITDNDKSLDEGSDVERIAREGVAVRMDQTSNHMHHKFMVVDNQILITGSYNWTMSAARYNYENILVTTEAGVVKSFLQEFNQLWGAMMVLKRE